MAAITGPFADLLREGRERHNARFATARRAHPALDGARFAALLVRVGDPIVRAVHAHDGSRARATADAIHDVLLEIVARELDRTHPAMLDVIELVGPELAEAIAESPRRALASIANATHRVATLRADGVTSFRTALARVAAASLDRVDHLADALVIAAWAAGIPMLRAAALDALVRLPDPIARAAVGLGPSDADVPEIVRRLRVDPWSLPSRLAARAPAEPTFVIAAIVGGFRGFGGPFRAPPRVEVRNGRLFVATDAERCVVWADRLGCALEACAADGPAPGTHRESITLRGDGRLEGFGQRSPAPLIDGPIASWAAYDRTLVAVPERSHWVIVAALAEST